MKKILINKKLVRLLHIALPKQKYRITDFSRIRFRSDDPHLSEHIDDILYGGKPGRDTPTCHS